MDDTLTDKILDAIEAGLIIAGIFLPTIGCFIAMASK